MFVYGIKDGKLVDTTKEEKKHFGIDFGLIQQLLFLVNNVENKEFTYATYTLTNGVTNETYRFNLILEPEMKKILDQYIYSSPEYFRDVLNFYKKEYDAIDFSGKDYVTLDDFAMYPYVVNYLEEIHNWKDANTYFDGIKGKNVTPAIPEDIYVECANEILDNYLKEVSSIEGISRTRL